MKLIIPIENIAKTCHEANKMLCISLGDNSQPSWEDAPEWQKSSAILGVKFHLSGDKSDSDSHDSWMKQKVEDGWIYGEIKDPEKKTHPCIVSHKDLPPGQRVKDTIFKNIVDAYKSLGDDATFVDS
jgi:hypothetical protein